MWRQGSVENIGLSVVALAAWLLGEGAQHHQSLFTSRIAVPIVVVQVVARRSNKNPPSPQNAKPLNSSKLLAPGTGVGAPTCGCLFSQSWPKRSVESVDEVHYL